MSITLIAVPYDTARREWRMGRGPSHLLGRGAAERARRGGGDVAVHVVEPLSPEPAEIRTAFELHRALAERVRDAVAAGATPLVLAGNCNSAVGTVAGLGADGDVDDIAVVWLDAHGDLNTPDTTTSGFLDGMALAMVTGRCWRALTSSVAGFAVVPDEHVVLVGARDLDPAERALLNGPDAGRIAWVRAEQCRAGAPGLAAALDALAARARRVYLHIDLDVHDSGRWPANASVVPGGLSAEEVRDAVRRVAERLPIAAAALTAYEPRVDVDGRTAEAALTLIETIADVVG